MGPPSHPKCAVTAWIKLMTTDREVFCKVRSSVKTETRCGALKKASSSLWEDGQAAGGRVQGLGRGRGQERLNSKRITENSSSAWPNSAPGPSPSPCGPGAEGHTCYPAVACLHSFVFSLEFYLYELPSSGICTILQSQFGIYEHVWECRKSRHFRQKEEMEMLIKFTSLNLRKE